MPTPRAHQMPPNPAEPATEPAITSKDASDKPVLALPDSAQADEKEIYIGGEGGGTAKLDKLGPVVVNENGTLSRITNWEKMTEVERANTLRVLGKRNRERLERLKDGESGGVKPQEG